MLPHQKRKAVWLVLGLHTSARQGIPDTNGALDDLS